MNLGNQKTRIIQSIERFYYRGFKPNQGGTISDYEFINTQDTTEEEYQQLSTDKNYITGFLTFLSDPLYDNELNQRITGLEQNPNSLITYNHALFFLLGLNPEILGIIPLRVNIQEWGIVNSIRHDTITQDPVAHILASTEENNKLLHCSHFIENKISYGDFKRWAVSLGFLKEVVEGTKQNTNKWKTRQAEANQKLINQIAQEIIEKHPNIKRGGVSRRHSKR